MKNNEITTNTCALKGRNNKEFIRVEGTKSYKIKMNLNHFLNYNCTYFGSSYEGRIKSSQLLLGMKYKLPIVIEEKHEIIFFPTKSTNHKDCEWIALNNIYSYEKNGFSTLVTFKNGVKIPFNISIESFENQLLRASKLHLIIKNRKVD